MKKKRSSNILLLTMVLLFILAGHNNTYAQQNGLSATLIKPIIQERIVISYERVVYKNVTASLSVQRFFLDRSVSCIFCAEGDRNLHKGTRFSLMLTIYADSDQKKTVPYIGGGVFSGEHLVAKTNGARTGFFSLGTSGSYGEKRLKASGVKLRFGFRKTVGKSFFIDCGMELGKSWHNQPTNTIILIPNDPTEELGETEIRPIVGGFFVEPMLIVGLTF